MTSISDDGAELVELGRRILAAARPGEQVEAYLVRSESTSVRAYDGEVEALTVAESAGVGVRVIAGGRQGMAGAGTLAPDVVAELLGEARDNATFAEPDDYVGLTPVDDVEPVHQDHWRDEDVATPVDAKIARAIELERRVRDGHPDIVGVRSAVYGDAVGEGAIVSTDGLAIWERSSGCHLGVTALASDGTDNQVGAASDAALTLDELDLERVVADAVLRATRLLGARKPVSGRTTIVLEPRLTATLLGLIASLCNGESVNKGRSLFADRMGEMVASPLLTLVDDPTDARSLGADTWDGEGLACRRNVVIERGRLAGFLDNGYSGRRSGRGSTASAVRGYRTSPGVGSRALQMEPGHGSLEELVAQVDDGVLVQSLTGLHSGVNRVSGDFSVGADGLVIRGGQPAEPIREATIASTLPRLLTDIRSVGADLTFLPGGTGAATLVVDNVSLSGS